MRTRRRRKAVTQLLDKQVGKHLIAAKTFPGLNQPAMHENFTLPTADAAAQPLPGPVSPRHCILIVDDDPSLRRLNTVAPLHSDEGASLSKHRDLPANRPEVETAASAADRCHLPRNCAAEPAREENDLAIGRGSRSSGATSLSFEVAR